MPPRPGSSRPAGLGIGAGLRRHAEQLLDQQMWCFGRDIKHPEGDALLRYGCAVARPPTGVVGSNAYTLAGPDGARLTLWGFGLCYAAGPSDGLIHLGRFQFRPTWRPEVDLPGAVWDTTRLPRFAAPTTAAEWARVRRLTAGALDALGAYEEWAHQTLGRAHRLETIRTWFKPRTAPGRIAPSWRSLARRVGRPAA